MQNRYKIILSNRQLYKEVEMPAEAGKLTVGTDVACDVRLRKELFFEPFELMFWHEAEVWRVCCSDNVYVTSDKVSKLMIKNLVHGDELSLKYHSSDADILKLTFMIDFEFEKNDYERCMDISGIQELYIGGTDWCQIYLNNPYVGQDVIVIRREQEGYRLTEKNTRYGVYVNDCKRTGEILLQDRDFIALANYSFYLKGRFLYTSKKSNAVIRGLPVYDVSNSKSKYIYPKFNRSTRIQSIIDTDPLEIQDPSAAPQKPRGNIVLQLLPAIAMLAVTVLQLRSSSEN